MTKLRDRFAKKNFIRVGAIKTDPTEISVNFTPFELKPYNDGINNEPDEPKKTARERYYEDADIQVTVAWPELSDVLIGVQSFRVTTHAGRTFIDLTAEEAFELATQLITAARKVMQYNIEYADSVIKDLQK